MGVRIRRNWLLLAGLAIGIAGCASTNEAMPEDAQGQIRATIDEMKQGLQAHDLDVVVAGYHDSFNHPEYRDKAAVREFLRQAYLLGYLDGMTVDDAQAQVLVEGTRAEVYPVRLNGAFGTLVLKLTFTEGPSGWKISWLDVEPA